MSENNSWLKECFNPKGRWNRKKFWLYPLAFFLITFIPMLLLIMGLGYLAPGVLESIGTALVYLWYIPIIYVSVLSYMKRFRDLDKNPWMTVLIIVPIVGIVVWVYTGFWKGTVGENKYGPDPLGGVNPTPSSPETSEEKVEEL